MSSNYQRHYICFSLPQGQSKVFESFVDLLEVKSVPSTVAYLLTEVS